MFAVKLSQEKTFQDWKQVFPDFATLEGSCLFIKKLIAVSLSAITYIRGIFPERAYGEKDLCGIKLKILNENCGLKSVKKFIDLIRNCYDAVEKKYLQQMSIGVVADPQNRDVVIELYNLVFQYKDDECSITCNKEKSKFSLNEDNQTMQATILMLKSICQISDILGKLPDNAYLTMKLFYYDDVTPSDYEPIGFQPCHKEKFDFAGKTMKIRLGEIDTDNHKYKFLLKTTLHENIPHHSSENSILIPSQEHNENIMPNEQTEHTSPISQSRKSDSDLEKNCVLECPCECKTGDISNTIICMSCGKMQHKICYAIFDDNPSVFYCVECFLDNTDESSNLDLIYSYQGEDRQNLCIMRRAITICAVLDTIGSNILEKKLGCDKKIANKLISRLESEGFIKKCGRNKYTIIVSNINNYGYEAYFPSEIKEDVDTHDNQHNSPEHEMEDIIDNSDHGKNRKTSDFVYRIEDETDIESSITQVQSLNLSNLETEETENQILEGRKRMNAVTKSRKRKLSRALVSPDNSEELFQSSSLKQKRFRK